MGFVPCIDTSIEQYIDTTLHPLEAHLGVVVIPLCDFVSFESTTHVHAGVRA